MEIKHIWYYIVQLALADYESMVFGYFLLLMYLGVVKTPSFYRRLRKGWMTYPKSRFFTPFLSVYLLQFVLYIPLEYCHFCLRSICFEEYKNYSLISIQIPVYMSSLMIAGKHIYTITLCVCLCTQDSWVRFFSSSFHATIPFLT